MRHGIRGTQSPRASNEYVANESPCPGGLSVRHFAALHGMRPTFMDSGHRSNAQCLSIESRTKPSRERRGQVSSALCALREGRAAPGPRASVILASRRNGGVARSSEWILSAGQPHVAETSKRAFLSFRTPISCARMQPALVASPDPNCPRSSAEARPLDNLLFRRAFRSSSRRLTLWLSFASTPSVTHPHTPVSARYSIRRRCLTTFYRSLTDSQAVSSIYMTAGSSVEPP
jgi:hypothetical protein